MGGGTPGEGGLREETGSRVFRICKLNTTAEKGLNSMFLVYKLDTVIINI